MLRDESGRVRIMRSYLEEKPGMTLTLFAVSYPEDEDVE